MSNDKHFVFPAVSLKKKRIKFTRRSADISFFFSFSLELNKNTFFSCYPVLTYCSGGQFSPWGGQGQPLCQAWDYENGGDRMLMRRPEALPPTAVPWSAPLCQPVMNLWSFSLLTCHPVILYQPHFQTPQRNKNTQTHTDRSVFRISQCCVCSQQQQQQHISYATWVSLIVWSTWI